MTELQLACASDGEYLAHTATMLHSALAQTGVAVHVHFLHGPSLDRADAERLSEMVRHLGGSICFHEVSTEKLARLPLGLPSAAPRLPFQDSPIIWARIFLPELLQEVDQVLYLDSDVVVMDSLEPLWNTPLRDYAVAAVTNVSPPSDAARLASLSVTCSRGYFNSGVLLLNLERWRNTGYTEQLLDCVARRAAELQWPDQDALNIVLGDVRLPLHPRWNCMSSLFAFDVGADVFSPGVLADACRDPVIRHFEGAARGKPWHLLCDAPMKDRYFVHRRQTPWPRCQLDGVTPANVVKKGAHRLGLHRRHAVRWRLSAEQRERTE